MEVKNQIIVDFDPSELATILDHHIKTQTIFPTSKKYTFSFILGSLGIEKRGRMTYDQGKEGEV